MPSTRHISRNAASPIATLSTEQSFQFPADRHLLITTPRHVFAWDATGLRILFSSSRGGIVTAKETKDGSGVLAIASSNVVVMHDTRRGREESWGLNAQQDQVRHLEYAPDAKTLYLTTSSDGSVQQYSTESSRLSTPLQRHEDPPVALALSFTGHLLLSASQRPPVVHLKNIAHNTAPIQLRPNASSAPVSCAAFHPERPNVYLLAFRDGTIAIYDATKLSRQSKDSYSTQQGSNDGEIARLQVTHRAVLTGDVRANDSAIAPPIAGAAFLPGFKTRVVTAGRDGRCKIIDFSREGEVLRTWHAKAPLTSLSILPLKTDTGARPKNKGAIKDQRHRSSGSHTIGGPTSTSSIIAVSRVDGKVHLYDSIGLLVAQTTVSSQEERILGLEWCRGLSPGPCSINGATRRFSEDLNIVLAQQVVEQEEPLQSPATEDYETAADIAIQFEEEDRREIPSGSKSAPTQQARKFTLHPDEVEEGTVRFTPSPGKARLGIPAAAAYDDLFSPIKPARDAQQRVTSPGRNRPRLSSKTFLEASPKQDTGLAVTTPRLSKSSPAKATHVLFQSDQPSQANALRPQRRVSAQIPPTADSRRLVSFAHDGSTRSSESVCKTTTNSNAQVLADIRKLSGYGSKQGTLSSYAASQRQRIQTQSQMRNKHRRRGSRHVSIDVADSTTWPTDSASLSAEVSNDDIWLTSDSEDDVSEDRRRRRKPFARPPARQTSRSKVDSRGTMSTAPTVNPQSDRQTAHHNTDGSTDEQLFSAASYISPDGTFSPVSEHVREMFPRSSSLSPGKRRSGKRSHRRVSPAKRYAVLTSMPPNVRPPKSPWDRLEANRAVQVHSNPAPIMSGALPRSEAMNCLSCPDTKARVQDLETEVAHLKGEVLALKAILRRNGLPFPACLR